MYGWLELFGEATGGTDALGRPEYVLSSGDNSLITSIREPLSFIDLCFGC